MTLQPVAINKANFGVQVETQHDKSVEIIYISCKKAVQLATKHLNQDASSFSLQTLKNALEELLLLDEDGGLGPMDTQLKSAGQILLGGGLQLPYSESAIKNKLNPKAANTELGTGTSTPALGKQLRAGLDVEELAGDTPMAKNANTEPKSNAEVIKLGPSNLVSQQLPCFPTPASNVMSHAYELYLFLVAYMLYKPLTSFLPFTETDWRIN
ncbi:hypothetical protein RhiLY_00315 [Ceratobasidium sp. AG-Ba]|nr:hypothetical protein RhiLY_00315 [Ceratobasidium sp. AG-Ba]